MGCEPLTPIGANVFENGYKYNDLLIVVTIACLTQYHGARLSQLIWSICSTKKPSLKASCPRGASAGARSDYNYHSKSTYRGWSLIGPIAHSL